MPETTEITPQETAGELGAKIVRPMIIKAPPKNTKSDIGVLYRKNQLRIKINSYKWDDESNGENTPLKYLSAELERKIKELSTENNVEISVSDWHKSTRFDREMNEEYLDFISCTVKPEAYTGVVAEALDHTMNDTIDENSVPWNVKPQITVAGYISKEIVYKDKDSRELNLGPFYGVLNQAAGTILYDLKDVPYDTSIKANGKYYLKRMRNATGLPLNMEIDYETESYSVICFNKNERGYEFYIHKINVKTGEDKTKYIATTKDKFVDALECIKGYLTFNFTEAANRIDAALETVEKIDRRFWFIGGKNPKDYERDEKSFTIGDAIDNKYFVKII